MKSNPDQSRSASLGRKIAKIKLVLTDCDGVLTDTGVYYSDQGEVMKRFSIRDGRLLRSLPAMNSNPSERKTANRHLH